MQIDLHHAGVYVLCRIAGMSSSCAQVVAYSSQYVDDAVNGEALFFKNGGIFKPTQTAHKLLNPRNTTFEEHLDIWVPFHYLPQGVKEEADLSEEVHYSEETSSFEEAGSFEGASFSDPLVVAPNSRVLALLLEDIRNSSAVHTLYRLGIGLHCLADAFAHQDFKGIADAGNEVRLLYGTEEKPRGTGRFTSRLLDKWSSDTLGVGHEGVLNNPDIPYADWAYSRKGVTMEVHNLEERFLPGIRNIYDYLVYFLARNPECCSGMLKKPFDDYLDLFRQLLAYQGTKEERHQNWLHKINTNSFGWEDFDEYDEKLAYDEQEWFHLAVEDSRLPLAKNSLNQRNTTHSYIRKEGFNDSHWVKFMQAAAEHRFLIVHCLLPELGIIIG